MRFHSVLSVAGALSLALTVANPAAAATGQFRYSYLTAEGAEAMGFMRDPANGKCLNLPMAASDGTSPAYAPQNKTDATATVYLEADCDGTVLYRLRPGGGASERLLVRSVRFS